MRYRATKIHLICFALLWTLSAPAMLAQQQTSAPTPPPPDAAQSAPSTPAPAAEPPSKAEQKAQAKAEKKQAAKEAKKQAAREQKKQQRKEQKKQQRNSGGRPRAVCSDGTIIRDNPNSKTGREPKLSDACKAHGGVSKYL